MTKDEAKEYLPLITALAEGKTIQFLNTTSKEWRDCNTMNVFGYAPECFRIKPEPKVIWVNEYTDGNHNAYRSKERAMNMSKNDNTRVAVKYIEVIE